MTNCTLCFFLLCQVTWWYCMVMWLPHALWWGAVWTAGGPLWGVSMSCRSYVCVTRWRLPVSVSLWQARHHMWWRWVARALTMRIRMTVREILIMTMTLTMIMIVTMTMTEYNCGAPGVSSLTTWALYKIPLLINIFMPPLRSSRRHYVFGLSVRPSVRTYVRTSRSRDRVI